LKSFHTEILTENQKKLLPLIKDFSKNYFLVGGTAIALHIGHRYSIDFDLFTNKTVYPAVIKKKIYGKKYKIEKHLYEEEGQAHYIIGGVKITFYSYPYILKNFTKFSDIIRIPDLLTLSAMKVFAISERNKWKDYVDLYYIFREHFTVEQVIEKTKDQFSEYNERLFFEQLAYFDDIDYSEKVEYTGKEPSTKEIKNFLKSLSLKTF